MTAHTVKAVLSVLLSLVLLFASGVCTVYAAETDVGSDKTSEGMFSEHIESFGGDSNESTSEAITRIKRDFTVKKILGDAWRSVSEYFTSYFAYFAGLLFIVFVSGIAASARITPGISGTVDSVCGLALCAYCVSLISPLCDNIGMILDEVCAFLLASLPSVTAIYAGAVGASSAAANHAATVAGLEIIQSAVTYVVLPGAKAVLLLSCVSAFTRYMDMSGLCAFVRGALMWTLGILTSLISAVMHFQTALGASADSLSVRGIRFAAQSVIPIVGGVIAESLRVVNESMRLVKSACGITGLLTLLYIALPPLTLITVYRVFLSLSAALAGIIGLRSGQGFLREMSGVVNILLAALAAVVFVGIILFGIFVKTVGA